MMPSKKSCAHPTADSSASWTFPGFSTFKFLTKMTDSNVKAAMMIHVTTMDSFTAMPPKTGISKTGVQFSSSKRFAVNSSVLSPSFSIFFLRILLLTNGFVNKIYRASRRRISRCFLSIFSAFPGSPDSKIIRFLHFIRPALHVRIFQDEFLLIYHF